MPECDGRLYELPSSQAAKRLQRKGSALLVGVAAFLKSSGSPVRQDRVPRLSSSPVRWRRGRRTVVRATAATVVVIIVVIVPVAGMRMRLLALLGLLRWMALIFLSPVAAVLVRRVAVSAVVPVVAVPAAVLVAAADVVAHERVGNPVENVGEKTLVARKRGRRPQTDERRCDFRNITLSLQNIAAPPCRTPPAGAPLRAPRSNACSPRHFGRTEVTFPSKTLPQRFGRKSVALRQQKGRRAGSGRP